MDNWIQTYKGNKFLPSFPEHSVICIDDIAHSLSLINRFNGHSKKAYSVAQHSVVVSKFVESEEIHNGRGCWSNVMLALLHDAAEAYIGDIITPIKDMLPKVKELEESILWCIHQVLLGMTLDSERYRQGRVNVGVADKIICLHEASQLMSGGMVSPWGAHVLEGSIKIKPWSARKSKRAFLKRYKFLKGKI